MIATETLPCDVLPVTGGVLVIPHVLPIHVPAGALTLTVAEWLNLADRQAANCLQLAHDP